MKRAAITVPDYRAGRARWSGLVQLAHTVAACEAGGGLAELSEKALAADSCWTNLAPYPRGLVCSVFARLAWAYGRQTDAAARARLAPLMITAAGMVDELLTETSQGSDAPTASSAPAMLTPSFQSAAVAGPVGPDCGSRRPSGPDPTRPATQVRLPYAED